jgi:hypothetical protein
MKAALVLLVLILATVVAFYIVWMNRASEKIMSAVIPIAVAALVGVFLSVFVFGEAAPLIVTFPTVFLCRFSDKTPFIPPTRPTLFSLAEIPELLKDHPERMADDTQGGTLYHHFLQRAIIDVLMQHHRFSWETDIRRFDTGFTYVMSGPSVAASTRNTKVSSSQMKDLLSGNRFADSKFMLSDLTLPPETKLIVRTPAANAAVGEKGEVILRNDFVVLSITTRPSMWMRSLGPYRLILGYSWDQDKDFETTGYIVTITPDFSKVRAGHPEMSKYKHWVDQIVSELQTAFDEQLIWTKTKEQFIFVKQLLQFGIDPGVEPPLTLNPPEYR